MFIKWKSTTMAAVCRITSGLPRICSIQMVNSKYHFSTSMCLMELRKLARVKVVDNSTIGRSAALAGKPVRIIHVYNKQKVGRIGDKVLVTIKGEKKKAYIVGCKQNQPFGIPKFDSNNIVLIDDGGNPLGTRIKVPVPSVLRKKEGDFTKILSLATKFV